jgi:hypothetical protein
LVLYTLGSITITWVQLYHKKDVVIGLKGSNGLWESPEWIVYISTWIFPHMLMASGFLKMVFPVEAWIFMGGLIMFGLTGRWGLEWLLALRTRSGTTITQEKTEVKIKTESESSSNP